MKEGLCSSWCDKSLFLPTVVASLSSLLLFESSDVWAENESTPLREFGVPEIKEPDEAGDILGATLL